MEGDAAIDYYQHNLMGKKPTKNFTLQGTVPTIIGCILFGLCLGIFISGWFLIMGPFAFIFAHIVFVFVFTYFAAYTHNVHWYEQTNQNDVMDLHSMQYDYKITEFSEIFGFEVKDESKE
ncbi:MAG: hypothetical protein ACPGMU_04955 [Candidatus Poseidoniaceae archaeon]